MPLEAPKTKHVHEFVRVRGSKTMYRCAQPDCFSVYNKKHLNGKASLCGLCHRQEIILGYEDLRRAVPRCFICSDSNAAKARRKRIEILKEMGI